MPWLDCHDLETALASLASGIGVSSGELAQALRHFDKSRFLDHSEDPATRMPRELLQDFGADASSVHFDGVYFFHGTRVLDPESFRRRGLLPADQMLEEIWDTLYGLVEDDFSIEQWREFRRSTEEQGVGGHEGSLYRLKTVEERAEIHRGPYGQLVREEFFRHEEINLQDYLGCPELPQDIAGCFQSAYGVDLEARFQAATVPCVVKFHGVTVSLPRAIEAALWYGFSMLREGELTHNSSWGFDGEGRPVPPDHVVDVELVP